MKQSKSHKLKLSTRQWVLTLVLLVLATFALNDGHRLVAQVSEVFLIDGGSNPPITQFQRPNDMFFNGSVKKITLDGVDISDLVQNLRSQPPGEYEWIRPEGDGTVEVITLSSPEDSN